MARQVKIRIRQACPADRSAFCYKTLSTERGSCEFSTEAPQLRCGASVENSQKTGRPRQFFSLKPNDQQGKPAGFSVTIPSISEKSLIKAANY